MTLQIGFFGLAPGPKKGQNGPFATINGKNRVVRWDATEMSLVVEFSSLIHKRPIFCRKSVRIHWAGGVKLPFRCLAHVTPSGATSQNPHTLYTTRSLGAPTSRLRPFGPA